jgi:hypothetical protein
LFEEVLLRKKAEAVRNQICWKTSRDALAINIS